MREVMYWYMRNPQVRGSGTGTLVIGFEGMNFGVELARGLSANLYSSGSRLSGESLAQN